MSKPSSSSSRRTKALWLLWPALTCLVFVLLRIFASYLLPETLAETDVQALRRFSMAAAVFSMAWLLARIITLAFVGKAKNKRRKPKLLRELLVAALYTVATIVAVGLLIGRPTGGILASSGLIIAILGFAIRNVLADVLSGIALGLEAPYRIGDWVEFDPDTSGRVVEIGWRTTRVLTTHGTYMILPNSHISRQMLTNYSAPRKHFQATVQVTLSHEVPITQAKEILLEAATKAGGELPADAQKPVVRAERYEVEGIVYTITYWVPSYAQDVDRRDATLTAIDDAIRKQGLPTSPKRINVIAIRDTQPDNAGQHHAQTTTPQ